LPVTHGSLLDFPHHPLRCMRGLQQAHGTIAALEEAGKRLVFVFGPEHTQQVLSDAKTFHSQFFAIRGPKNSAQRHLTCGILSMNGEDHKRHRRLVLGPFQKKAIEPYRDDLVRLADEMVGEWRPGEVRNVFRDMTRHMLRVTSSIVFGSDLHELAYDLGGLIERWVAMNHEVGIGAFVPAQGMTDAYGRLLELAGALEEKVRALIEYRRSRGARGNDVLSQLLRAHDDEGGMTHAELVGHTAVIFGAAHLTTANTLTWTLFLLAQHPAVATALAGELAAVLRGGAPTIEQLDKLPLLDRVLKESMRILPASAYSHRVTSEPVQLGPFRLPRGQTVIFSQVISHHLPDQFPEPRQFRPERWRTLVPSPYAYFPFAAGPRMCVGAGLAMMTLKITLATILQRYHLSVEPCSTVNANVTFTMLNPTAGMPMRLLPPTAPFTRVPVEGNIHELVALGPDAGSVPSPARAA
jgi:cytochrome P450